MAMTFAEDVGARFEAYGWHVQRIDGQDVAAVDAALSVARGIEDDQEPQDRSRRDSQGIGTQTRAKQLTRIRGRD